MKEKETGCKGFYLSPDGRHCEALGPDVLVTAEDCKRCNCPFNQYRSEEECQND